MTEYEGRPCYTAANSLSSRPSCTRFRNTLALLGANSEQNPSVLPALPVWPCIYSGATGLPRSCKCPCPTSEGCKGTSLNSAISLFQLPPPYTVMLASSLAPITKVSLQMQRHVFSSKEPWHRQESSPNLLKPKLKHCLSCLRSLSSDFSPQGNHSTQCKNRPKTSVVGLQLLSMKLQFHIWQRDCFTQLLKPTCGVAWVTCCP